MTKHNIEYFKFIKQKIFMMIFWQDSKFSKELDFFERLEDNYNKQNYQTARLNISDLIDQYKFNAIKLKFKLFKLKLIAIPDYNKYRKDKIDVYFNLLDFEKSHYQFINGIIKEQLLYKTQYKECIKRIKESSTDDFHAIFNSYITLKSIVALQNDANKRIGNYNLFVDEFYENYDYKSHNTSSFTIDDLNFYFEIINKIDEKKKVKYLRN